jgi:phosphate transport system substrate-binding protein
MNPLTRRSVVQLGMASLLSVGLLPACSKKEGNAAAGGAPAASAVTLTGSGASFPAPIYSRWFQEFSASQSKVRVNYQATGSGAGVKAFSEGQTDFGASDAAMSDEELQKAGFEALMLPVTAGSIVLAFNLEGVTHLKLSREVYANIFLGKILQWNDPKIQADNPGVKLPDQKINVVHRSDGSGTTYVFTKHLAAISQTWNTSPGVGTNIEWPVGVGGRKNDGVAALVKSTPGAIGYLEYGYAVSTKLPMAELQNKVGAFVAPTLESAAKALGAVTLPDDMRAWVSDPDGADAYPIVTYTWLLARKQYTDPAKAAGIKQMLEYCLGEGQKLSASLYYVPLPDVVLQKVKAAVALIH